ncbi:hypothetical protein AGMMS50218_09350 [Actinomycetota bacterium]|nr:hypothetical protein AGMMS50218_09350 [Actinomycetota bacterium]
MGAGMTRGWWWVVAVVVLAAQVWITVLAPAVLRYEGALIGVAVVVLIGVNFIRSRRRGTRVADTLRPDAAEFIALQDDLLGRVPSSASQPQSAGPVATMFEVHDDPEGDITKDRDLRSDGRTD